MITGLTSSYRSNFSMLYRISDRLDESLCSAVYDCFYDCGLIRTGSYGIGGITLEEL